jgi:hypothetical protein
LLVQCRIRLITLAKKDDPSLLLLIDKVLLGFKCRLKVGAGMAEKGAAISLQL